MQRIVPCTLLVLTLVIAVAACQSAQPTTAPPSPTAPPPTAAPPTAAPRATAIKGDQLSSGKFTYEASCSCHSRAFSKSALVRYGTAQKLLDEMTRTMPPDPPGSLSTQDYYDVVAYMLSQAGLLPAGQTVNGTTAGSIQLQ